MADNDDEIRKRRREREKERDEEEERERQLKKKGEIAPSLDNSESHVEFSEKLDDLTHRADTMIEQLNNLYHMFAVGIEKMAPITRRKQLDEIMVAIQMAPKMTPSSLFKTNNIQSRYHTHKERWDKLLKDLESGKVKRVTGPKKHAV